MYHLNWSTTEPFTKRRELLDGLIGRKLTSDTKYRTDIPTKCIRMLFF